MVFESKASLIRPWILFSAVQMYNAGKTDNQNERIWPKCKQEIRAKFEFMCTKLRSWRDKIWYQTRI